MATRLSKPSETTTEDLFRGHYGVGTFLEKSAIPDECGFKSKKGSGCTGFPDFYLDTEDYAVVVEAKASAHTDACTETQFYMINNALQKDMLGIAISGQTKADLSVTYYFRDIKEPNLIRTLENPKDALLHLSDLSKLYHKEKYGETVTTEVLVSVLKELNQQLHKDAKVRDSERSLFFSGLMIALNNKQFRSNYMGTEAPSKEEVASTQATVLDSHHLNDAIIKAISAQLNSKINNLSKQFSWEDKFSFIRNIDYSLFEYKSIIKKIEDRVFKPFKNDEKQDILGRAYKIFLSRAGKAENKNIILTPDHIKSMMVKLAELTKDDVVLDTCTGSGGFLMESMETMTRLAHGDPDKIKVIKENQLIGFEVDSVLFALACSNMFLHGDGKTNLLYRSSLLNTNAQGTVNSTDTDLLNYIKRHKPTKVIINPPYENNSSFKFAEQAIDYLEPNGRLIIIMPTPTLSQNEGGGVERLFKKARLDFVIRMPENLFSEQARIVQTSIFGFTKTPHNPNRTVMFCSLDDDGLESIQHKGRIDIHNRWNDIEAKVINTVQNRTIVPGMSELRSIVNDGGKYRCVGYTPMMESVNGYRLVRVGDLFNIERGELPSQKAVLTGKVDFITAADEWKKHSTHSHDKEALVYAVSASGSLGRCHYVNGKFTASNLCLILTAKVNSNLPVNMKFYKNYFMAAREKIIRDLADGTSKKTIDSSRFENYLIEYIPIDEQNGFTSGLDSLANEMKVLEAKIEAEKQRQKRLFHCLRCIAVDETGTTSTPQVNQAKTSIHD